MEKLIATRTFISKLSLFALVITFAGILDLLISGWRTPDNRFDLIQGHSAEIIGKFYSMASNPADLGFVSDTPGVSINFDKEPFTGFWLGDKMWRGHILLSPDLKQGTASVRITFKDLSNIKPKDRPKVDQLLTYQIRYFENERAKRSHDMSLVRRYLGIPPWALSVCGLPVILITGIIGFFLSGKIERSMAESGKAEIFRVGKKDDQLEIHFGMGKDHGLTIGERLMLFNDAGLLVTEIVVSSLGSESAVAFAECSYPIVPGFLVSRV